MDRHWQRPRRSRASSGWSERSESSPRRSEQPDLRLQLVGPWRHCDAEYPDPRGRYHIHRKLRRDRCWSLQRRVRPPGFPGHRKRLAGSERRSLDLGGRSSGALQSRAASRWPSCRPSAARRRPSRRASPEWAATACPASVSCSATRTRRTTTSSLDGAEEPASFRFPRSSTEARPCWQAKSLPNPSVEHVLPSGRPSERDDAHAHARRRSEALRRGLDLFRRERRDRPGQHEHHGSAILIARTTSLPRKVPAQRFPRSRSVPRRRASS